MVKKYGKSLFIFRRDLRLADNTGLIYASKNSEEVIPCFVFDDSQTKPHPYLSIPGFRFMQDSLKDLEERLKQKGACLYLFEGKPWEVVEELIEKEKIGCVFVNRDYTPFSLGRDEKINAVCKRKGVSFESHEDLLLNPPEKTVKKDGRPYTVFTPYFRNALGFEIQEPEDFLGIRFCRIADKNNFKHKMMQNEKSLLSSGLSSANKGRSACLEILDNIGAFAEYEEKRDFPGLEMTTRLSAHLKFGACSVREVFHAIKKSLGSKLMEPGHSIIRQLYWRDFFTHIAFFFPHVFGHSFHEKYDQIPWENDETKFSAWCDGKTGFPLVDAGMRQLNETGFMHGRARMVCASFLVKDLHIDWRWGERYFASRLFDYDPSLNNGNWQWAASTGCDSQPYFRIFNPWAQQKKYDKDCEYIKKWIPELKKYHPEEILGLEKKRLSFYRETIVDHRKECAMAKSLYSKIAAPAFL